MKVISLAYNENNTVLISVDINDNTLDKGAAIKYRHLYGQLIEQGPSFLLVRVVPKILRKYTELFN